MKRFVSLEAAAERYDMSARTLRRMIAAGQITGYRVAKRMIRIDLDELDAVLLRPIPDGVAE